MATSVTESAWWTLREVAKDRTAFAQVADVEASHMRAKNFTNADHIDAIHKARPWGNPVAVS